MNMSGRTMSASAPQATADRARETATSVPLPSALAITGTRPFAASITTRMTLPRSGPVSL